MTAIKTEKLTKKFKDLTAVDSLDLSVEAGELFSLLGVNGAGKTTLIDYIMDSKAKYLGEILVDGENIRKNYPGIYRKSK